MVRDLFSSEFIFFLYKKIHRAKTVWPILIKISQVIGLIHVYNILKFHWAIYYRTGDMAPPADPLKANKHALWICHCDWTVKTLKLGGWKKYEFSRPPPRNVLLYGPIRSIIFILQNFEVLPPVRGVWKLLKMVKELEFSKLW